MRKTYALALTAAAALASATSASAASIANYPKTTATGPGVMTMPRSLLGTTSQKPCRLTDNPTCGVVNLSVTKDLRWVKEMKLGYQVPCSPSDEYLDGFAVGDRLKLKRSGSRLRFKASGPVDDYFGGDLFGVGTISVRGKLNRMGTRATGTFRLTEKLSRSDTDAYSCDTGVVHWSAGRPMN